MSIGQRELFAPEIYGGIIKQKDLPAQSDITDKPLIDQSINHGGIIQQPLNFRGLDVNA